MKSASSVLVFIVMFLVRVAQSWTVTRRSLLPANTRDIRRTTRPIPFAAPNTQLPPSRIIRCLHSAASSSSTTDNAQEDTVVVPRKFVPFPFVYRQEKTLRVVSLTNLGMGICRTPVEVTEEGEGEQKQTTTHDWVIFVPNVIPGELVRVRIYRNYKNYSDADLLEVLEPSQHRVEPVCPLFETCGGCQYQHMSIQAQRDWKTQHVEDVLQRVGHIDNPNVTPTVGTPHVLHYRSKITPHYNAPTKVPGIDNSYEIDIIGFKQKSSRKLVDVPYCHIATEAINKRLVTLREEKKQEALEGKLKRPKRGATLLLRDAHEGVITDPTAYVTTTVSGLKFQFGAGNFFQNNPYMLPVMVEHVVKAATQPSGRDGRKMTHLIDCYCGSGLFCLTTASSFDVCVGIEVNDNAVQEARANAHLNDITNCAFVAASAEAIFESDNPVVLNETSSSTTTLIRDFPREATVVVVDPPRKGCSNEFLDQLYKFSPQRVVYMSCDPATQARDAKGLMEQGYEITSVQPFDLFPQTRHIECLVVFEKR